MLAKNREPNTFRSQTHGVSLFGNISVRHRNFSDADTKQLYQSDHSGRVFIPMPRTFFDTNQPEIIFQRRSFGRSVTPALPTTLYHRVQQFLQDRNFQRTEAV